MKPDSPDGKRMEGGANSNKGKTPLTLNLYRGKKLMGVLLELVPKEKREKRSRGECGDDPGRKNLRPFAPRGGKGFLSGKTTRRFEEENAVC